ncbi:HEAT repeat domain-containing protein [Anaeromyxobacter paludicola]|uniref:PBS lyase n=1 Tax=Anaeromyxobacter paludicola TaxID=2918171 RepID=A0ABN6N1I8_9BACT|nr:HEAT repeat domain-containing protein [Anaeromyxobacter paludicola]BDG06936.1 PBS lyase [Anaeromyxobacter paludicola]
MTTPRDPPDSVGGDAEEEARYRAVCRLDPSAQLAALLGWLADPSWRVRNAAVERITLLEDPAPALPALVAALGADSFPGRRNASAAALVRFGARAVGPLLGRLAAPTPEERTGTLEILGEIRERQSAPAVARALGDPDPNVRVAAAEALGKIGGPECEAALRGALELQDRPVRQAALEGLAQLRAAPPVAILSALWGERLLRRPACRLLGFSDDPAALALLAEALSEPARTVREIALGAVGQQRLRRSPEALGPLARAVRELPGRASLADQCLGALGSEDPAVAAGGIAVLQWMGDPAHAPALARAAEDERLRPLAAAALELLGHDLAPVLRPVLHELSPAARAVVLGALARQGDASVLPDLLAEVAGDDELARAAAVEGLGRLGDLRAVPALAELLRQPDASLSGAAVAALALLATRGPEHAARVRAVYRDCAEPPAPALLRLVARVGEPEDLPALRAGLRAPHRGTRVAAAAALSSLASQGMMGMEPPHELLDALDDRDPSVRAAAAQAVGASARSLRERAQAAGQPLPTCGEAARALAMALRDEDALVRAAASRALGRCGAVEYADGLARLACDPAAPAEAAAAAVHALAELGRAELPVLESAARHPDPEVVKEAVAAAAAAPGGAPLLLAAAAHPRWDVRRAAARAISQRGDEALLEPLRRLARAEEDGLVAEAFAEAVQALESRPRGAP